MEDVPRDEAAGETVLVLGSVLTAAMALITDRLGTPVELLSRPRGLEVY